MHQGSIPAHTGKPLARPGPGSCARVYPRPHGEAPDLWPTKRQTPGLSPPTRGSPARGPATSANSGSIPAHTGKPGPTVEAWIRPRVYPRPHGEAVDGQAVRGHVQGLSPPTRGSLQQAGFTHFVERSIPAHTGKPPLNPLYKKGFRVYPRPHGEAVRSSPAQPGDPGLSPPTRGSRPAPTTTRGRRRSIPAHTGKPPLGPADTPSTTVYPRPHGEAARWTETH